MNISDYEWLEQVPAKNLPRSSLVLVTKFTRHVRRLNGRVLSLSDPLLLRNMLEETVITDDDSLKSIFKELMTGIKSVALNAGLDVPEGLLADAKINEAKSLTYRGVQVK